MSARVEATASPVHDGVLHVIRQDAQCEIAIWTIELALILFCTHRPFGLHLRFTFSCYVFCIYHVSSKHEHIIRSLGPAVCESYEDVVRYGRLEEILSMHLVV